MRNKAPDFADRLKAVPILLSSVKGLHPIKSGINTENLQVLLQFMKDNSSK